MRTLITLVTLVFLATPASAKPKDDPSCHWVKICNVKKKHPLVAALPLIQYREKLVFLPMPVPCADPVVAPFALCPERKFIIGGHLSLGLAAVDPYANVRLGLRLEVPEVHLGLDVGTVFTQGFYAQLLIYAYQGKRVKVSVLNPGFLITGDPFEYLNNKDVSRRVDLLIGAGVQIRLICHLNLIADLTVAVPDPGKLGRCDGHCSNGKMLDVGNVVGNAFGSTRLYLGILVN